MPELPEVETIRRSLLPLVKEKVIGQVRVFLAKAVKPGPEQFAAELKGKRITDLQRRGKYLLVVLDTGQNLVLHLRMSGRLVWRRVRLLCLCLFLVFGCALISIQTHSSHNGAQFG